MNITDDVGLTFKKISDNLGKVANNYFKKDGITKTQMMVLGLLHHLPEFTATQKQLEVMLDVSHPTINGILKRLEDKKLVTTKITVDNRLTKNVTLAKNGIAICEREKTTAQRHEKMLLAGFSKEEKKVLVDMLQRIITNVDKIN